MVQSKEVLPTAKAPAVASAVEKESTTQKNGQRRLRLRKAPARPSSAVTTFDGDQASDQTVYAPPSSSISSPRGAGSSEVRIDFFLGPCAVP
jgi:hypothetical protein